MASVLFCDIIGSTRLVAGADPEDAGDWLGGLLDVMQHQVRRFGGTLCQTMGDGILAVFGAPRALEDHAVRACFAADAIIRDLRRREGAGAPAVRIGVSAGEILWDGGALGGSVKAPAIGQSVHMAAKLQQSASANGIRVCPDVAALAAAWVDTRPAGEILVDEGRSVPCHDVTALRRHRARAANPLPIVGRDAILDAQGDALAEARLGRGSAHVLVANAGVGKSRVGAEVAARAGAAGVAVVEWSIPSVRPIGAPEPLSDLVADLMGEELPAARADAVGLLAEFAVDAEAAGALVDLLAPDDVPPGDGQRRLALAAEAVLSLVKSVCAQGPVLLLVEDVHWAGTDARAILDRLSDAVSGLPLLLLVTSRAPAPHLAGAGIHRLGPLPAGDGRALLDRLLGDGPGLEDLKGSLLARGNGNPFFLVECVHSLVADGRLVGDMGALRPKGSLDARLPSTVKTLLAARIDGLDRLPREVLRAASVVGPTFDVELVAAALGLTRGVMIPVLGILTEAGFVEESRILPRLEYSFRHALLHEAAYAALTKKDRKAFHENIAQLLGSPVFAALPGRLAALARHAHAAGLWPLAANAGRDAGTDALRRGLTAEAANLLALSLEALDRLPTDQQEVSLAVDVRLGLAKASMASGLKNSTGDILTAAVNLARGAGDRRRELTALSAQISFEWVYGTVARAAALSKSALGISAAREPGGMPHFEFALIHACVLAEAGDYRLALETAGLLDTLLREPSEKTRTYFYIDAGMAVEAHRARCWERLGRRDLAAAHMRKSLAYGDASSLGFDGVYSRVYACHVFAELGEFPLVLSLAEEALQRIQVTGTRLHQARLYSCAGHAMIEVGQIEAGKAALRRAQELISVRPDCLNAAWVHYHVALGLAAAGEGPDAAAAWSKALALAQDRGYGLLLDCLRASNATLEGTRRAMA